MRFTVKHTALLCALLGSNGQVKCDDTLNIFRMQLPELTEVTDEEAAASEAINGTKKLGQCDSLSEDDFKQSFTGLGEMAQDGIVDAKYLEETGPRLFKEALDKLKSQLSTQMDDQLEYQIQNFTAETKMNVINQGGQRRKRKFEDIQNKYSFKQFSSQYELIMRESVGECNTQVQAEAASQPESSVENIKFEQMKINSLFDNCIQAKLQTFVDKFVSQALDEAQIFMKENILLAPNKSNMKKSSKKHSKDPYSGKEMQYTTQAEKNLRPHIDDEYLITPNVAPQRFLFGQPAQIDQNEYERWQTFKSWVADKGYKPVSEKFEGPGRFGLLILYLYGFSHKGSSDEVIFEAAYRNMMTIEEYEYPTDPEKLRKFIDTGAIRVVGRLTELGHQPVLDINVNKIVKEVVGKQRASAKELEHYFTFWFLWVKNYMMVQGKIERMFLIFDLKDVRVRDLPIMKLQPLLKIQEELFKGGPFRNVVVNQSWFLNAIVTLVGSWFDEHTREIAQFASEEDTFQTLLQFMSADQIEHKYGGNKPSSSQYFPPLY